MTEEPGLVEVAVEAVMESLVLATALSVRMPSKRGGKGSNRDLSKCGALSSVAAPTRPTPESEEEET